jgi:hypothetical protein
MGQGASGKVNIENIQINAEVAGMVLCGFNTLWSISKERSKAAH